MFSFRFQYSRKYNRSHTGSHLGWLAAIVVGSVSFFLAAIQLLLPGGSFNLGVYLLEVIVLTLAVLVFTAWAIHWVGQREAEIQHHVEHLEALHSATLALSAELDLDVVLQEVVDLSRNLIGTRYGVLGVFGETGQFFDQLITSGLPPDQNGRVLRPLQGRSGLGYLTRLDRPMRLSNVANSPDSVGLGFPIYHPNIFSLLSVPIRAKGQVLGVLYLADKLANTGLLNQRSSTEGDHQPPGAGSPGPMVDSVPEGEPHLAVEFSTEDETILSMFAVHAAIAIENARLVHQQEQLTVLQERERFRRDLHDGTIQSIYAIGLMLEDAQHQIAVDAQIAQNRISRAIHELNRVILDIRNYILDLPSDRLAKDELSIGIEELLHTLQIDTFLDVETKIDAIPPGRLSTAQRDEILHIIQEAISNIQRHAQAERVRIALSAQDNMLSISIEDNGVGFDPEQVKNGGLDNMRERAQALGGELWIETQRSRGTTVFFNLPLPLPGKP